MLQQIYNSWNKNRGNLLLSLGLLTCVLTCVVWYFNLLPDIKLVPHTSNSTLVSTLPRQQQPSSLVAILRMPSFAARAEAEQQREIHGVIELHAPEGTLEFGSTALFTRWVQLRADGGPSVAVFNDAPMGRYAGVAYIDLNENGKLDFDESLLKPIEPFRLSSQRMSTQPTPGSASLDLDAAAIELESARSTLIEFDFRPSVEQRLSGSAGAKK